VTDKPHITYYNMGAWPLYVGFTTSAKAFGREMRRLNSKPAPAFINPGANATMHTLEKDGTRTCIIAFQKPKAHTVEQVAGLIAHEAVHVAQELWDAIGETRPGREAEAYLVQQIVQCCLQDALSTGRARKDAP
jgi:hypothetical protein